MNAAVNSIPTPGIYIGGNYVANESLQDLIKIGQRSALVSSSGVPLNPAHGFTAATMPELMAPMTLVDAETLSVKLSGLMEMVGITTGKTTEQALKKNQLEKEAAGQKYLNDIAEQQRLRLESEKAAEENKVANWFRAIFSVIGAALACFVAFTATGLSAGALGLAAGAAVVAMMMAVGDLATTAAKEAGSDFDMTIGGIVNAAITSMLANGSIVELKLDAHGNVIEPEGGRKAGVEYKTAAEIEQTRIVAAGVMTGLVILGTLVAGGGAMALGNAAAKEAAKEGGKALMKGLLDISASTANTLTRYGTVGEAFAGLAEAGATTAGAVVNIRKAEVMFEADKARADAEKEQGRMEVLKNAIDANQEFISQLGQWLSRTEADLLDAIRQYASVMPGAARTA